MNALDLVVYLVLALAVFEGWRRGAILQLCSLAGLVVGICLAVRYGTQVGMWLRIDESAAAVGGFAVVVVATVIAVAMLARLLRRLFRFAGFGIPDIVLGIAVSVVKYLLLLSVGFAALDRLNAAYGLLDPQTVEESRWFRPVRDLSERIFPILDEAGANLSGGE